MNLKETMNLLTILKDLYPNFGKNSESLKTISEVWAVTLSGYDYEFIISGIESLVKKNKYPPSVGEVIQSAYDKSIDFLEVISLEQGFCEIRPDVWVDMGKNKKPVKYSEWTQRKGLTAGRVMIG